ncbi:MAG TPA: hypothetical protein VFA59_17285 [Vicinamibacterales bacterium]|nr:hypothetical protein [Vicinamibacterales bacterium]
MAEPKTKATNASVTTFLNSIKDAQARRDSRVVVGMMSAATKAKPKMWGSAIVGFGSRPLTYADGRVVEWPMICFSPRKQNLVLYLGSFPEREALLTALGKHSCGKGCLYVKRLSDVHVPTLRKLVNAHVKHARQK